MPIWRRVGATVVEHSLDIDVEGKVCTVAFSRDDTLVALAKGTSAIIIVCSAETGHRQCIIGQDVCAVPFMISCMAFSPVDDTLAFGGDDGWLTAVSCTALGGREGVGSQSCCGRCAATARKTTRVSAFSMNQTRSTLRLEQAPSVKATQSAQPTGTTVHCVRCAFQATGAR